MFLPKAPGDGALKLYINPNKTFLYAFGIISTLLLTGGGVLFSLHSYATFWFLAFVCANAFYLSLSYILGAFAKPFDYAHHDSIRYAHKYFKPTVDIYLPTAGEPLAILKNTYHHVDQLKWDQKNLNVYVLDDKNRMEVALLAHAFGFKYIARTNAPYLKKAGNIRNAFAQTGGEYILILDADFCPRPDFLENTVPYMIANKNLGILQTPQFFTVEDHQPWIQRGAASVQELFYRLIQVNRNQYGASICVGTCALYRRSALAPHGGTYPIEHSEDVHTGFQLLKDGWDIRYIPVNLAAGACPDTREAFFNQQYRWCLGSTSLFLNRELFWKTRLKFMQRLSFLSGMLYYQATAIGIFFTPFPGLYTLFFSPENVHIYNAVFSLPSLLFGTLHMKMWNKQPYGLFVVRTKMISYWSHLFAIKDKILGTAMGWEATGKVGGGSRRFKLAMRGMLSWNLIVTLLVFVGCCVHMRGWNDLNFYPLICVTAFNLYLTLGCSSDNTRGPKSAARCGLRPEPLKRRLLASIKEMLRPLRKLTHYTRYMPSNRRTRLPTGQSEVYTRRRPIQDFLDRRRQLRRNLRR